jgi:hypothetical protein
VSILADAADMDNAYRAGYNIGPYPLRLKRGTPVRVCVQPLR